jgi:flagellar hook-associated protein 1
MLSFDIGLSAIRANQQALNTVSNNIANATTPGYHRQRVVLADNRPVALNGFHFGTGVHVKQIERLRDVATEQSLTLNLSMQSEASARLEALEKIERLLTPGAGSLHARVAAFFNQIEELAARPSENVLRLEAVAAAQGVAREITALNRDLDLARGQLEAEIRATVADVNQLAEELARIETEIRSARSLGGEPNTLLDQRDRLVSELAELVDINPRSLMDDSGTLITTGGWLMVGPQNQQLTVQQTEDGRLELRTADGLGPITPASGKLAGLLTAHNEFIAETREALHEWTQAFLAGVDSIHATGIGAEGPVPSVTGHRSVRDVTLPLAEAETLLPVFEGRMHLTLTDRMTGERQTLSITVDPEQDSLLDIVDKLNGLPNVQASLQPGSNNLTITAESGYLLDFTGRPDSQVDTSGMSGTALPTVSGISTGNSNREWTVTTVGSGEVGVSEGLVLRIADAATGEVLREVNVGQGYPPGESIPIAEGISIRIGPGSLESGDSFTVSSIGDPDTSGLLAALGMQSLFQAVNLSEISVNPLLLDNPHRLAMSRSGDPADGGQLARLIDWRGEKLFASGTETIEERLATMTSISGLAVRSQRAELDQLNMQQEHLGNLRDSVSGVDPNEELLLMLQFQRSFQAAARFMTTADETVQELLQLVR